MITAKSLIDRRLFRLSIGIIPLLLFSVSLIFIFTQQQQQILHRYLFEWAAFSGLSVERAISEQIGILNGLSASRSLDRGDFKSFRLNSQRLLNEHPEWRTVIVTDATMPLFNARFQPDENITPLRDPQSLQRVWDSQKPYVSDLSYGHVAIRVPVFRDDRIRYTLVVPVKPTFFLEAADNSQGDSKGYIIVGSDGIVIASSIGAPAQSGQVLPQQFFLHDSSIKTIEDTLYTSLIPIENCGWKLILFAKESVVRAPFDKLRTLVYAGALLAVVLTLIMVFFMEAAWVVRHETERLREEISVRLKIEDDLRQSEASLKEAQRLAEIGSWTWDIFSGRQVWSDEVYRIFGRERHLPAIPYPEVEDYCTPEGWAKLRAVVDGVLSQGNSFQCDVEVIRKDGSHRWITVRGEAVRDDRGKVIALRGTIQDITAQKEAEFTIRKNRNVLQLFIEYAPASIAMFDTEMRIIAVSQRFLTDYGIEGMPVAGKSHYDIFPEMPERWKDVHRRCLLGATERCEQDPFVRAGGQTDWIRWEVRPWHDQNGDIGGIILFSEVITDKVEAVKRLEESEKKFRDIFDRHSAVKLIIEPDDGKIIDANKAAAKFYGWSAEQLRKMRIQDIHHHSPEEANDELEQIKKRQGVHFEFCHKVADGSIRDVAIYSSTVDLQGKILIHLIIHDITNQKKIEREQEQLREQLIQAQKMESVGQLAGGVAHDYNNMLSVIIGYTELVMNQIHTDDPIREDLGEIHKAAQRSAEITRQLLAFARKQTINPHVLDFNATVAGMLKMLRRLIGEEIDLAWLPGPDLWSVKMDSMQIDQLLANLCVNARDAIEGVGRISIETQNITINEEYCTHHFGFTPGEYVLLVVSDNGSGMDKETLDHIFEPFFTTKETGAGTGLGLATVFGIVKQNKGLINVYSEPGKGTTFRLYFPRHVGITNNIPLDVMDEMPRGQGEVVLLVEDEASVRNLGAKMLRNLGYTVLEADLPSQAIRQAAERDGKIDLLMTDVVMPEMNGRELAEYLQARYPNIKILFTSGYTSNVIAHRGVLDEDVNFLSKPFSINDLAFKVQRALGPV